MMRTLKSAFDYGYIMGLRGVGSLPSSTPKGQVERNRDMGLSYP